MIISIPLSAFANTPNFSSQDSTINKTKLVLKDQVKNTDGIVKTIEVYENAEGRTVYTRNSNGNVELMLQTKFIEGDLNVIDYKNSDNNSPKILKTAVKNFYYTKRISFSEIIDKVGTALTVSAIVALIYATGGGATVIEVSIKKEIAKLVGGLIAEWGFKIRPSKKHGIQLKFYQYNAKVRCKGKKVNIRKTNLVKVSLY